MILKDNNGIKSTWLKFAIQWSLFPGWSSGTNFRDEMSNCFYECTGRNSNKFLLCKRMPLRFRQNINACSHHKTEYLYWRRYFAIKKLTWLYRSTSFVTVTVIDFLVIYTTDTSSLELMENTIWYVNTIKSIEQTCQHRVSKLFFDKTLGYLLIL